MTSAATISDVATMAGVSIKTVSRVLNREPNVSEKTRDRVAQAITQLRYKPSLAARGLAGGRSFLIGLLYGNASDSFLGELQRGILRTCRERHYGLALFPVMQQAPDMQADVLGWIGSTQPDGIILSPPLSDDTALVDALLESGVKFISVSSAGTGRGPAVHIDEAAAAQQMTRHLIEAGHRRLGFVKGPADHVCSCLRYEGFCAALSAADIPFDDSFIARGDFHFSSGVEAAKQLLSGPNRPTAIFASNDDMASGVMHVAYQKGLTIPGDLAVAGFDDTPVSRQLWPGLSTVKQPIQLIGQTATERLLTDISGAKNENSDNGTEPKHRLAEREILPFELMLRASTKG